MPRATPKAARDATLDLASQHLTHERIALMTGIPERTVGDLIRKYEPVTSSLRAINRDLFTGLYQYAALESVDQMYQDQAAGKLTAGDRRNYAVSTAVFAEKALLFAGQPTSIVAGLHEVRVELPDIMAKLAEVGSRMRALSPPGDVTSDEE